MNDFDTQIGSIKKKEKKRNTFLPGRAFDFM